MDRRKHGQGDLCVDRETSNLCPARGIVYKTPKKRNTDRENSEVGATSLESVTVRKMGSPGSLMVTHISQQVNLLFSDYGKNFEKMAKVAIVYKYEFCPLSFKTKIKSLG